MLVWILLALYALGYIPTWRRAAWILANDLGGGFDVEGADVAFALFISGLLALTWPVLIPFYLAYRRGLLTTGGRAFLKEPDISRREREVAEREQRIARLEADLGIGDRRPLRSIR